MATIDDPIKQRMWKMVEIMYVEGEFAEVINQFDEALQRMPRRTKSLRGKMAAFKALDQEKWLRFLSRI